MNNRFQHFARVGLGPPVQLHPAKEKDLKIQGKREGQNVFFRRKLQAPIILGGEEFHYLLDTENGPGRCQPIYHEIRKYCGGQWLPYWKGVYSLTDVEWNLDGCLLSVTPAPDDAYKKFLENYGKEFNVLTVPRAGVTVTSRLNLNPDFEFRLIEGGKLQDDAPDPDTWAVFLEARYWIDGAGLTRGTRENSDVIFRLKRTADYEDGLVRELPGWKVVDQDDALQVATYAKVPDLYNFSPYRYDQKGDFTKYPELIQLAPGSQYDAARYVAVTGPQDAHSDTCGNTGINYRKKVNEARCVALIWEFGAFTFNRGRKLLDVVDYLVRQTAPEAVQPTPAAYSTFFSSATNPATKLPNKLLNALLFQKTDITAYRSTEAAGKAMLSLKALTDYFRDAFRVFWFLDDNGRLRLEHESYFQSQGVLDTTVPKWEADTAKSKAYSYEKASMPRYEKLTFQQGASDDFLQGLIDYDSPCVNQLEGENTAEVNVTLFTHDLTALLTDSGRQDSGFVLLVHANGRVLDEAGALTGTVQPNAHLSAANLVASYWRHNRVQYSGRVNGQPVAFASTLKLRKQKAFSLTDCCLTVNPYAAIKTQLGPAGSLDSWTEKMAVGKTEFVVLHEAGQASGATTNAAFTTGFDQGFAS